jgi:hypothetical protein
VCEGGDTLPSPTHAHHTFTLTPFHSSCSLTLPHSHSQGYEVIYLTDVLDEYVMQVGVLFNCVILLLLLHNPQTPTHPCLSAA